MYDLLYLGCKITENFAYTQIFCNFSIFSFPFFTFQFSPFSFQFSIFTFHFFCSLVYRGAVAQRLRGSSHLSVLTFPFSPFSFHLSVFSFHLSITHYSRTIHAQLTHNTRTIDAQYTHYSYNFLIGWVASEPYSTSPTPLDGVPSRKSRPPQITLFPYTFSNS